MDRDRTKQLTEHTNKVNKHILNNSAIKNGMTPNSSIGLSHPIKLPNQIIPRI